MKHVALLRGINVGWNKKVDMKELKKVFEMLGFENVLTYINSGNVIFRGENPDETIIEKAIEKHFWFFVPTITRNKEQIQKISQAIPDEWESK